VGVVTRRLVVAVACFSIPLAVGLARAEPAAAAPGVAALRICTNCTAHGGDLSRYQYVILNAWDARLIPGLKAKNPGLKALVYQNAAATYAYACHDGRDDASLPTGVGYCSAAAQHADWFLKDTRGSRVEFCDYPGTWQMDVGSTSYQEAWAARVLSLLKRDGWDGVMVDDVNSTERYHLCGRTLAAYPTDSSYEDATRRFLAHVGPSIRSHGFLVLPNINYDCAEACWSRFIAYTSGGVREWWSKNTTGYGGQYADNGWDWANGFLRLTQRAGKIFIGITYAPGDDVRSMEYARASFLLDWNGGHSALSFEPAAETTDPWHGAWTADLGAPAGARYLQASAWRRDFTGGTVVLNPSRTSRVSVSLGAAYRQLDGSVVTAVTLAPMTAAILRRTAPSAAPPPRPPHAGTAAAITLTASLGIRRHVTLNWKNAQGGRVEIYRNGRRVAVVANDGAYARHARSKSDLRAYQLCELGRVRCSRTVTLAPAEGQPASRRAQHPRRARGSWERWLLLSHG
jgi:Hypothetical glycosyl hydrolase family 15